MNLEIIMDKLRKIPNVSSLALFMDKTGAWQVVTIVYGTDGSFMLKSFDEKGCETGYMNVFVNENNRYFLDTVYCYEKYRGRGIATRLSEITDHLLEKKEGFLIRGAYIPMQLAIDRELNPGKSREELDQSARAFYQKCGYKILTYEDYIKSPEDYPDIDGYFDFRLGEDLESVIVYKKIVKKNLNIITPEEEKPSINPEFYPEFLPNFKRY